MNIPSDWAKKFHALGSEPRLQLYLTLMEELPGGLNMTELQTRLGMKASTLAHHMRALVMAGLVLQERQSKEQLCYASNSCLQELCDSVLQRCCGGNAPPDRNENER